VTESFNFFGFSDPGQPRLDPVDEGVSLTTETERGIQVNPHLALLEEAVREAAKWRRPRADSVPRIGACSQAIGAVSLGVEGNRNSDFESYAYCLEFLAWFLRTFAQYRLPLADIALTGLRQRVNAISIEIEQAIEAWYRR
jgi:hypothetical protein